MANSGIYWIDVTFNWCVRLLYEVAGWLGITYEEINVWLFVIALPIVLREDFTFWTASTPDSLPLNTT